ncbi:MAG: DUF4040 domain-containing protein [Oscillospiraceae bacterium]|nr:DUF4040 domain-containing protein [Oscillospiraceae bacterium]
MILLQCLLLLGLIVCAASLPFIKRLLTTAIVFMAYSSIMAILWVMLESPDLAITEAAVGAGVTTVLFITTLSRIRELKGVDDDDRT